MSIYYITTRDGTIYELDATRDITYSSTGKATDNPVESGASVADHYINNPDIISLVGSTSSLKSFSSGNENSKSPNELLNDLRKLKSTGTTVTLHYGEDIGDIPNCVIEDLSVTQNPDYGTLRLSKGFLSAYNVRITLKQIILAESAVIGTSRSQEFIDDFQNKATGSGSTSEATEEEEDRIDQGLRLIEQGITGEESE